MAAAFETVVELFEQAVAAHRLRPALLEKTAGVWQPLRYGELAERVDAARAGLAALGVGEGGKVAVVADNRVEWAVACYATAGLGAAFVPMYESQLPEEWHFILRDCGASVAIVADGRIASAIEAARGSLPALEHVLRLDAGPDRVDSFAALLERGRERPTPAARPPASALFGLIYTSGTTGAPKGVMLSHGNIASNIRAIHQIFTFSPDDRSLAFLPWAHSFGQVCELHGLLSMGCSLAINDEVRNLLPNLAEVRPTILFAVPRIFNRLYDVVQQHLADQPAPLRALVRAGLAAAARRSAGEPLGWLDRGWLSLADRLAFARIRERFGGRLRYAISGSAALDREVATFIDSLGILVYEGYGLTETSPIVTANFPGHRKLGSVGRPIPGVTVEIDESVGEEPGQGEVVVRGPNVMLGYYNRPDETAAVLSPDGAFRTGDLGTLDEDGYLYITGRLKEQYKLENGKYVVPGPLEEKIKLSHYVSNAFVYGSNRPYNVALVVPEREAIEAWARKRGIQLGSLASDPQVHALLEEEIAAACREVRGYERVRKFAVVEEDFTTENGMLTPTLKLKRRVVLERYGALIDSLYE